MVSGFDVSDDLTYASVQLSGAAGSSVSLASHLLTVGTDDTLRIPLPFRGAARTTSVSVNLVGHPNDTIRVVYYPRATYEAIGAQGPGTIVLYTTLPRAATPQSTEPRGPLPHESVSVAQQRWNDARYVGAIAPLSDPLADQVRQLYEQFNTLNDPSTNKVCSDFMTGIDTYWAMSNRSCYVWCSGYARVTSDFLRSTGVPARLIALTADVRTLRDGTVVQSSEGHATVEMWQDGHWQWIGPTFRVLRVVGANGFPLSLAEVVRALANPAVRAGLRFTRLDPTTNDWVTRSYDTEDQAFKDDLMTYMTADKRILTPES